jgi:hypothetical protein
MLLKLPLHPRAVALIILCCCAFALSAQQAASIAFRDADGVVRYQADTLNNYIADFSHAGYKNGEAELPDVPVVKTILVIEGDNTAHIQAATAAPYYSKPVAMKSLANCSSGKAAWFCVGLVRK